METSTSDQAGFLNSLRTLGDSLLGTIQDRLKLFGMELQEEKFRLIQIFIWISAAIFTGMMAITFASIALVYLFWESARLPVLIGLTVLYSGALVVIVLAFRRYLARQPSPFNDTLAEIGKDRECIRNKT
ncbi:MAG TPA: phage holin family protein [Opitutaceae bacterium]|nr:phage holin family protein [Opitutaceae bacterium]